MATGNTNRDLNSKDSNLLAPAVAETRTNFHPNRPPPDRSHFVSPLVPYRTNESVANSPPLTTRDLARPGGLSIRATIIAWTIGYGIQLAFYTMVFFIVWGAPLDGKTFRALYTFLPVLSCSMAVAAIFFCFQIRLTKRILLIVGSLGLFAATHLVFVFLGMMLFWTE